MIFYDRYIQGQKIRASTKKIRANRKKTCMNKKTKKNS